MRAVVQRVGSARVEVEDRVLGAIGPGLLVFLGVGQADTLAQAAWLAEKVATLRIFLDAEDKLNLSLLNTGGACLVVSQLTLWGDCAKSRGGLSLPALPRASRPGPCTRASWSISRAWG